MAELTLAEFQLYLDDFNKENAHGTERGTVLVGVSVLDDLLLRILTEFMIDDAEVIKRLTGPRGPMSSFSSRIDATLGFGLIDNIEAGILHKFREIRNEFAHKIGVTLRTESLQARCFHLHNATIFTEEERTNGFGPPNDPRLAFGTAAIRMALTLNRRLTQTVPQKRKKLVDPSELADRGYPSREIEIPSEI